MTEILAGLRLAFKEAGISTRKSRRYNGNCFLACWNFNWFLVTAGYNGIVSIEPLKYAKKSKCYVRLAELKYGYVDLADPKSIPYLIRYLKVKRKAIGRFI